VTRHARYGCGARRGAEDRSRPADVGVNGGFGDSEEQGDLLRLEAAGDGAQDFTLTIRQPGD
jgi:hypothetical protein